MTGTGVGACSVADLQDNDTCDNLAQAQVDSTGAYTLTGLQTVPYIVAAAKDVDGSGTLTDGDYLGGYTTDGQNATPVTPSATGINITMQVISGGTNPTPGELTGTWTGTTVTPEDTAFGTEQTTFEFTQSGSSVSGTLALDGTEGTASTDVTGSVNGSSATISASFDLLDQDGNQTGTLTYTYEGTVSGTTYSGTVTLSNGINQVQGQFSVTQSSAATSPLGNLDTKLLNRMFERGR